MNAMIHAVRANSLLKHLTDSGVSETVAKAIVAAGAPSRHAARITATRSTAIEAASDWGFEVFKGPGYWVGAEIENPNLFGALAVLFLDWNGTGGPGNLGARATSLNPQSSEFWQACPGSSRRLLGSHGLGTGRWQAQDGNAYRAAAREALGALLKELATGDFEQSVFWAVAHTDGAPHSCWLALVVMTVQGYVLVRVAPHQEIFHAGWSVLLNLVNDGIVHTSVDPILKGLIFDGIVRDISEPADFGTSLVDVAKVMSIWEQFNPSLETNTGEVIEAQ
jgi:hypothetical protein